MEITDHIEELTRKSHLPAAAFAAWWDNIGPSIGHDLPTEDDLSEAEDAYIGEFKSFSHLAEHLMDETGGLDEMPENLRYYFDFDKYGNDLRIGGDAWENGGHYFWNR